MNVYRSLYIAGKDKSENTSEKLNGKQVAKNNKLF